SSSWLLWRSSPRARAASTSASTAARLTREELMGRERHPRSSGTRRVGHAASIGRSRSDARAPTRLRHGSWGSRSRSPVDRCCGDRGRNKLGGVIARMWRGWTRREDADAYVDYLRRTGIAGYRATAGNSGAWILRRDEDERTEFVTLSFWDSLEAVAGFAGEDVEAAVFYPEDERFLVDRELFVSHYDVFE